MPQTESPFRYPGGKTQLFKFVTKLLDLNNTHQMYIEPFAGGAGIPLKLLIQNKVSTVWINDYDAAIFSVWNAILNNPNELIEKIRTVPFDYYTGHEISPEFSISFWRTQKNIYLRELEDANSIDLAFATLFLNRTNKSGIITAGPIGKYDQSGANQVYSRFNKKTTINKIKTINHLRDRIRLTNLDALQMIPMLQQEVNSENSFIFFDPPYFKQGKDLYYSSFNEKEHQELAKKILTLDAYRWITTYDPAPQIRDDYRLAQKKFEYSIKYSANNSTRGSSPEFMFASPVTTLHSFEKVNLTPFA